MTGWPSRARLSCTRRSVTPPSCALPDGGRHCGNLTTDAHLAALSVEYGAAICSYDADFSRFPGVKLTNPDKDL